MEHQKITFFFTIFFVHRIVLFCGFLRAPNRAFFWFSSCTKSCFLWVFFVHQIVFFCGFLRAPNRVFCDFLRAPNGAPVHAFLFDDFALYTKSCSSSSFLVIFFVHQIVFFSGFLRAPSRAFFWFSSCTKSCFFCVFFVHQIVLFILLFFVHQIVPNRAFLRFSSCTKWCSTSCHYYKD